jgi:hypothetical protein
LGLTENKRQPRAGKDAIRSRQGSRRIKKTTGSIKIDTGSLSNEELCQLVLKITHGGDRSKSFLRRMVILWDSLKSGQTDKVVRFTRQNKDPAFAKLMAAISDPVSNGELGTASIIIFLAAGFAYQNTLDYYLNLRSYLDRFR